MNPFRYGLCEVLNNGHITSAVEYLGQDSGKIYCFTIVCDVCGLAEVIDESMIRRYFPISHEDVVHSAIYRYKKSNEQTRKRSSS